MNFNRSVYLKYAASGIVLTAALFGGTAASAGVTWSIGVGLPGVVISEPAPVYYVPAPVYAPPAPIYYQPAGPGYYRRPPPVYYRPAPVYYGPPPPVYYRPHHHRWHRDWHDDRD
ncbi:hypothetical protein N0K08_20035 [Acidovorax sp. Be4]|uniref:PXPV repeat-containing protein n=1 Tax=Acidovorax bellezanensis TaxID=2976702 RepID=A0ABT2PSR6_9BURK|nr:hypothetical protein [Acidovorax sp. Be4]MCT9812926.1 hypothetical protein [Acidovorax sp. Be4]